MKHPQHNKLAMLLMSLAIYIAMGSAVVFAEPDLIIDNYTLISSKRVSRVEFEYTYQAEITNTGSSAVDVSAVLTSTGNGTSIVEGKLDFGSVLNASMAMSTDTFTIRQNRLFQFDRTALVWDITFTPGLDFIAEDANRIEKTITTEGGTVTALYGDVTFNLTIPPSALFDSKEISLTPVSIIDNFQLFNEMLFAVKLDPEGLQLLKPATLTIDFLSPIISDKYAGFIFQDDGSGFHLYPVNKTNNQFVFDLSHFSVVGVAETNCNDIDSINFVPIASSEQIAKNKLEKLYIFLLQCGYSTDDDIPTLLRDIHYDWFFGHDGVNSLLKKAHDNPEQFLVPAISQLNSWFWSLEYETLTRISDKGTSVDLDSEVKCGTVFCDNLGQVAEEAGLSIFQALSVLITNANDDCLKDEHDIGIGVMEWINLADSLADMGKYWLYLGFDEDYGLDIDSLLDLKTCGIQSLEVVPARISLEVGESKQLSIRGRDIDGNIIELEESPQPFIYHINQIDEYNNTSTEQLTNNLFEITGVEKGTKTINFYMNLSGNTSAFGVEAVIDINCTGEVIIFSNSAIIPLGGVIELKALVVDCNNEPVLSDEVKWSTSDGSIADLSTTIGPLTLIRGNQLGVVTITATYQDDYFMTRSATTSIEVKPPEGMSGLWHTEEIPANQMLAYWSGNLFGEKTEHSLYNFPEIDWHLVQTDNKVSVEALREPIIDIFRFYGTLHNDSFKLECLDKDEIKDLIIRRLVFSEAYPGVIIDSSVATRCDFSGSFSSDHLHFTATLIIEHEAWGSFLGKSGYYKLLFSYPFSGSKVAD